ncbi:MAG: hypothetical protein HRT98_02305 [Mycoplasmatales bacterium]|nr:hypothetical protein [Mycoplasmatales bacterium]
MLEKIKAKHKLNKWFYFIPIIGTMIYSVIVEFTINTLVLDGHKQFKIIKKYKTIFALISLIISIAFLITFFVMRNKHGYGPYPWFFWVGLTFGLAQNLVPAIPWFLYKKGIEDFENKNIVENEDIKVKINDTEQKTIKIQDETKE